MNKNTETFQADTFKIAGREFSVRTTGYADHPYILVGPRGAAWLAVRYTDDSSVMRLVNFRGQELRIHGNAIRVTDASGDLRRWVR